MITYELCLLLRIMPKNELVTTLRRSADCIFNKGGIIRQFNNLGTRKMPYKTSSQGMVHHEASYFVISFNAPPKSIDDLSEEFGRDVDIIRRRIFRKRDEEVAECTLDEELKPPPYRKKVQELMAKAKKVNRHQFKYNSGLDYYPFQS